MIVMNEVRGLRAARPTQTAVQQLLASRGVDPSIAAAAYAQSGSAVEALRAQRVGAPASFSPASAGTFFETYKNEIIIGGALAAGLAAILILRR